MLDEGLHHEQAKRDQDVVCCRKLGGAHRVPRIQTRFTATTALWPPKAKEFEIAMLIGAWRASFAT